jgi:formylglycine-generating enzyme required for sulfatase activity
VSHPRPPSLQISAAQRSTVPDVTPHAALYDHLIHRFANARELATALRRHAPTERLPTYLRDTTVSLADYADEVVGALRSRGLMSEALLEVLGAPEQVRVQWRGLGKRAPDQAERLYRKQLKKRLHEVAWLGELLGKRFTVDEVYVEVQVVEHRVSRGWLRGDHAGGVPLRRVLDVQGEDARWALIGEPGGGKSTLLRRLALDLLEEGHLLPVVLHIEEVRCSETVAEAVRTSYGSWAVAPVQEAVNAGRAVVLVDGLDEAVGENAGEAVLDARAALARWDGELESCPLIVASRPVGFTQLAGFGRLTLQTLRPDRQEELLGRLLDDPAAARTALEGLRRHAPDWCGNPLLLTLVAVVVRRGAAVPDARHVLYAEATTALIEATYDPTRRGMRRLSARSVHALEELALRLHGAGHRSRRGVEEAVDALNAPCVVKEHGSSRGFVELLLHRRLLVVEAGVPGEPVHFPHRTVGEYLAGCALVRRWRGRRRDEVVTCLQRAEAERAVWAEVLALAVDLVSAAGGSEDADALLLAVREHGGEVLALHVLGSARGVSLEVVLKLLRMEAGRSAWEKRCEAVRRFPTLAVAPEVALELCRRFAETTTHGAELWWARWVALELGSQAEEDTQRTRASEVAEAVLRLPTRDREVDRQAALAWAEAHWRTIPRGRFWMGSAGDEEGRWNPEGPRHEVEVLTDYELAAVPVTNRAYAWLDPEHEGAAEPARAEHPVAEVSWWEADFFAAWLDAAWRDAGRGELHLRLPSEEEWERGARGGTDTPYWSGSTEADLNRVDWVGATSGGRTHPVGLPPAGAEPHPFGLYDVHGNVWEWCGSTWSTYRAATRTHDPCTWQSPEDPDATRVYRSGSFVVVPRFARSAVRDRWRPLDRGRWLGFRLLRVRRVPEAQ